MRRTEPVVLAYHFQEDPRSLELLHRCLARSFGIPADNIRMRFVHEHAPTPADMFDVDALVVCGAKWSVWQDVPNQLPLIAVVQEARANMLPMFGICFGAQLFAHAFGGTVERRAEEGEWGTFALETLPGADGDAVFGALPPAFAAQCAHNDQITALPAGAVIAARSERCAVQAFALPQDRVYAVQFHPERSKQDYETILDIRGRKYFGDDTVAHHAGGADTDKVAATRATLAESPDAEHVLRRFMTEVVIPGVR